MMREAEAEKQRKLALQEKEEMLDKLERKIRDKGKLYDGEKISIGSIRGDIINDTFNIYGSGDKIVHSGDLVWLIQNNGMDGDDWTINNILTGGAGAYGYMIPYDSVAEDIEKYQVQCEKCQELGQ